MTLPAIASAAPTDSNAMGAKLHGWSYAGLLALDIPPSGVSIGPKGIFEVMYGIYDLAPALRLDVGGRAGFAYHSIDTGATGASASYWYIPVVADGKIVYGISPDLAIYGDLGLGLAYVHASFGGGLAGIGVSDSTVKFALEIGGGVSYALNPGMNLLGEIRLSAIGDTFIALPTVGLQWH